MLCYAIPKLFPTPVHQAWGGTQAKLHWVHVDSSSGALPVCLYENEGRPGPRLTTKWMSNKLLSG